MDLNTILIILGVIALLALVAHGIWSNRREKSQYFKNANTFAQNQQPNRFNAPNPTARPATDAPIAAKPKHSFVEGTPQPQQQALDFEEATVPSPTENQSIERAVDEIKITLPSGASNAFHQAEPAPQYTQSEPALQQPQQHSQPTPNRQNDTPFKPYGEPSPYADPNRVSITQMEEEYTTPTVSLTPLEQESHEPTAETQATPQPTENKGENPAKPSFIMLYVVAPENREFNGGRLAQALDGLGFIFGDQHIYHRHLDLTSASPVLFSVANLQQPGTFDPYDMDNLFTVGIALFMQLPSPGNDTVNLKTMIRAARNLADELGGFVLTDKQEIFNDHAEQEYLAKVA
ncbi:cell division protein ZipA [Aggregatibacter actinomycetemcomitans]|uniref:cell division protein ZipA n=1 Tax=Aggregatibacter actinomycetemcomitans TaxID=714 RepID=UPI00023FF179|nr:cell division protein ZipA [Aggregatibacter actinomycetemcomitans]EHK91521.1 cell division protein ZipA [Aggregatibacter actinomycetemcomitans RhAA1]KNE78533.1 cell division protein ZipA [Aggregatibacter actinomycetemcomitans RhAA1]MBN6078575.1 cell division protein ZipA [Aggregatibacter actinomycetemcomitans]